MQSSTDKIITIVLAICVNTYIKISTQKISDYLMLYHIC